MAAIDKIYVGWDDYCKLKEWCESQPPLYDKYGTKCYIKDYLWKLKKENFTDENGEMYERPVMNNPYYIDYYIIKNCPIEGVQEAIGINYGRFPDSWVEDYYKAIQEDGYTGIWKEDDFVIDEDGIHLADKYIKRSTYYKIRNGEVDITPVKLNYTAGKHCKLIYSPHDVDCCNFNRCKLGSWFVDVRLPRDMDEMCMWYNTYERKPGTWDFAHEFVCDNKYSSSSAMVKTIKALKRLIRKWKLPVGTIVKATGRYSVEHYEFIVTP